MSLAGATLEEWDLCSWPLRLRPTSLPSLTGRPLLSLLSLSVILSVLEGPSPSSSSWQVAYNVPFAVAVSPHFCPRGSQRQAGHRAGAGDSALEGGVLLGLAAVGWVPPSSQLVPAASGLSLTSPPQPCPPPPRPPERCFLVPPLHGPWPALPGVKGWSDCLWSGKGAGAFLQVKAWGCGGGWGWGGCWGPWPAWR